MSLPFPSSPGSGVRCPFTTCWVLTQTAETMGGTSMSFGSLGGCCVRTVTTIISQTPRDVAALISVNQKCHLGRRSVPRTHAKCHSSFSDFPVIDIVAGNLNSTVLPLCVTSDLMLCLSGPQWANCAIWPLALSQGIKEHQINSLR